MSANRVPFRVPDDTPVYAISVAASLAGLHPQTLRQYDRLGLVSPTRVAGRNRLYSAQDIARLREIAELSSEGLSLEGIKRVLVLFPDFLSAFWSGRPVCVFVFLLQMFRPSNG